jgi:hypothetical protein
LPKYSELRFWVMKHLDQENRPGAAFKFK